MELKLSVVLLLVMLSLSFCAIAQNHSDLSQFPIHAQFKRSTKQVILYLTGDGGWNGFSESLVGELGKNGYPVIALDTRKYFWSQKTPDQFAKDIKTILGVYLKTWNKDSYSIVGYSFGADVAAFLPGHLDDDLSSRISTVVLLSPGLSTGYVVKLKNLINFGSTNKEKYKVYPELLNSEKPVWCIFGKDEESDLSPVLKISDKLHKIIIPGSHRYDDNIPIVTKAILKGL
jgi:type IV secretory pathway VirJ component